MNKVSAIIGGGSASSAAHGRRVGHRRAALLDGASFKNAVFSDAVDFRRASLTRADFTSTHVVASFRDAKLAGAVFKDANVSRCDFTGAKGLATVDFSGAVGLRAQVAKL